MNISDILSASDVLVLDNVSSKRQLLQDLAEQAAHNSGVDARTIFDVVLERENLGSTAFGQGTALPHGRIAELGKTKAVFAKIVDGIDFDATDGHKTDLVFMLLSPENSGADHLLALSKISQIIKDEEKCLRLRQAVSPTDIYKILTE